MIFLAWMIIAGFLIGNGLWIWNPWQFNKAFEWLFKDKVYCTRCHYDITVGEKFRANFEQVNSLEDRDY